jgi:hypothetical protein
VGDVVEQAPAEEVDQFDSVPTQQGPLPPAWRLQLGVHGGWDTNPRSDAGEQEGSFQRGLQGSVAFARPVKHGHFGFRASASTVAYERLRDQDRQVFGGDLSWLRRLSPRSNLLLNNSLSSTYARDDLALVTDGQIVPGTTTLRNTTGLSIARRLSEMQSLTLRLRHEIVDFRDEEYVDGQQSFLVLALNRRVNERRFVGLNYSLERTAPADRPVGWRNALGLSVRGRPRPELLLAAGGGLVAFRTQGFGDWRIHPRFDASSSLRRRSFSTTLSYQHTVNQAYGYGNERIADIVALTASKQWRASSANLGYAFGVSRDPDGFEGQVINHGFEASLRRTFSRNVVGAVHYSLRRRLPEEPEAPYTSQMLAVTLSYARSWY